MLWGLEAATGRCCIVVRDQHGLKSLGLVLFKIWVQDRVGS